MGLTLGHARVLQSHSRGKDEAKFVGTDEIAGENVVDDTLEGSVELGTESITLHS